MTKQSSTPCSGRAQELASKLVGSWQEFTVIDGEEKLDGDLVTEFLLDGCVLSNRFTSADGKFSFISFAYVDPETDNWFETYMFNNGRASFWRWVEEGDEIVTYNESKDPSRSIRLRIVHIEDDSYEVIEEKQADGDWMFEALTITRRLNPQAAR